MSKQSERDTLAVLRKLELIDIMRRSCGYEITHEVLREAAELGITPLDIE